MEYEKNLEEYYLLNNLNFYTVIKLSLKILIKNHKNTKINLEF